MIWDWGTVSVFSMHAVQWTDLLTYVIRIFVISSDDSQHILCRVCLVISVLLAAFSILCWFLYMFSICQDDSLHIFCRVCLVISVLLAAFSILCCFITCFVYLRMTVSIYYAVFVWLYQYYSLHLVYCVDFCTCLVYVRMTLSICYAVFVWLFQYYSLHLVYWVASLHVSYISGWLSAYIMMGLLNTRLITILVIFCQYKSCSANISHIMPIEVIFC